MDSALCLILVLLGVVAYGGANPRFHPQTTTNPPVKSSFACPGPGSYQHPYRCNAYISCSADKEAFEMQCPEGLHYVRQPSSLSDDVLCDLPELAKCNSGVTPPVVTPSTLATTVPPVQPPTEGDPCDPAVCVEVGYCTEYFTCSTDGRWVKRKCGKNLWWNPQSPNGHGNTTVHGGTCDEFNNLPEEVKAIYLADEEYCILPCTWFQMPSQICTDVYRFRKPFDNFTADDADRILTLKCPSQLVWLGEDHKTCGRCGDALDFNGNSCC